MDYNEHMTCDVITLGHQEAGSQARGITLPQSPYGLNTSQLAIFSHVLENSINTGSRGSKSIRASFTSTTDLQLSITLTHCTL